MTQRVPLPDEGQAEEMRTWVNKRCCAIWCDHFRQRRRCAEDSEYRLPWLIPWIKRPA